MNTNELSSIVRKKRNSINDQNRRRKRGLSTYDLYEDPMYEPLADLINSQRFARLSHAYPLYWHPFHPSAYQRNVRTVPAYTKLREQEEQISPYWFNPYVDNTNNKNDEENDGYYGGNGYRLLSNDDIDATNNNDDDDDDDDDDNVEVVSTQDVLPYFDDEYLNNDNDDDDDQDVIEYAQRPRFDHYRQPVVFF